MSTAAVPTASGQVRAHLAVPADVPAPGVIVIHEAFGLNDDIREHADRLARAGYLAVAPDLYSWGPKLRCVRAAVTALRTRQGPAVEVLDGVRAWLAQRTDCTGRIGVIGFCMGGGFALLLAPRPGYAAASVNYGFVPENAEEELRGACPVIGSFGGSDRALRGHAQRLDRALAVNGVQRDVKEYDGAGHSFLNAHTGPLLALDMVLSAGFAGPAALDAWGRITSFFDAHLR